MIGYVQFGLAIVLALKRKVVLHVLQFLRNVYICEISLCVGKCMYVYKTLTEIKTPIHS